MDYKQLIKSLGFTPQDGAKQIFLKKYSSYTISIDFENEKIDFGSKIKAGSKSVQNFSPEENWVVLECVNRLLEKGYEPKNITLEKTWPAGHGTSGRLDICVHRDDGTEYLLIECKTYGKEFDKEYARIKKDGGQLFTYFKFSNKSDIIMLYASDLKGNNIGYKNEIVKIENDYRIGDVRDFYEKWNKLTKDNGVFDSWVKPYNFESKALTIEELEEIKPEDSSFIFNRFLEILRHNVVSDKPNAFNKIFTLFLCKIYDEKVNEGTNNELAFQWKEGIDDNISFQLRLTDLYKNGMYEFLEKRVTDFSEADFEIKYKNLDESVKNDLLLEFKKIRLEKNNEFAIKEVYDQRSFEENAKVVKQVVELLQNYKIRYAKKQQYLSDFFEMLLTTGLKQESGQFFTPVPIAQFIIKSLPIDDLVKTKLQEGKRDELLPFVIDYAAGSGHFITESMHAIQRLLENCEADNLKADVVKKINSWKNDPFDWALQYVYGIEKDYRLVKVGKVGCYLHGDGLANVIHSDGLANFNHSDYKGILHKTDKDFKQDNKQFDILVSNPPYSVSAFKNTSREYYKDEDYELYSRLTDNSSEIECLFVERSKQLLKNGGVAGIILPSSILSNGGIYAKSREIILQYFEIIGITEFGSNTFMATGTNTVVLFLRRRNNYDSINLKKSVDAFFSTLRDVTLNGIEKPVQKYVDYVWGGLSLDDYVTLLKQAPNEAIKNSKIYKEYRSKIKFKTEKEFWATVFAIENEKLYYFILAHPQKVVLVKSGEKNNEKQFLGYEFSNRRGSEGIHPIKRGQTIDECTQLFDAEVFDNHEKASTYIYKAFKGDFDSKISEKLKNNVLVCDLVDIMTFDRVDFEKNLSLSVKKKINIKTKWEVITLGESIAFSQKSKKPASYGKDVGAIPFFTSSAIQNKWVDKPDYDLESIIIGDGGNSSIFFSDKFSASDHNFIFRSSNINLKNKFIYYYYDINFNHIVSGLSGTGLKNISKKYLSELKIPFPPQEIQVKIISEIEKLEIKENTAKNKILELKNTISKTIQGANFKTEKLDNVVTFKNGLNYNRQSNGDLIDIVGVKDFQNYFSPNLQLLDKIQIEGVLGEDYKLKSGDLLVVRSNGSANLVGRFLFIEYLLEDTSFSGFTIRLRPNQEKIIPKYLCHYLRTDAVREQLTKNSSGSNIKSLNQALLSSLMIPFPTISQQREIVSKIDELELKIAGEQQFIDDNIKLKNLVLKKYL